MANNPYVNKVVYGGRTLVDLTSTTVTEETLAYGSTALDASGALITGKMIHSNKNFIVNGYFVGGGSQLGDGVFPINQRGQASYSVSGNTYFIDRWRCMTNLLSVELVDGNGKTDGMTISASDSAGGIMLQSLPFDAMAGKTVTYSVLFDGGFASAVGVIPSSNSSGGYICNVSGSIPNGYYCRVDWAANGPLQAKIGVAKGQSLKVIAVKLELGSTQTLAHQEGDAWVLNELPNFDEEFEKCERHLQVISTTVNCDMAIGVAFKPDATKSTVNIVFLLPTKIRGLAKSGVTLPTDIEMGFTQLGVADNLVKWGATLSAYRVAAGQVTVLMMNAQNVDANISPGTAYRIVLKANSKIIMSDGN